MNSILSENLKKNHLIFLSYCPFWKLCKICDTCISESIIARGLELLLTDRVQWVDYLVKIKRKLYNFF